MIDVVSWPRARLGEAVANLAELAGLEPRSERAEVPTEDQDATTWLVDAARWLGSEERRVGKECSLPCRSRWSPYH